MKKIDKIKKILRIVMLVLLVIIIIYALLIVLPKNKTNKKENEGADKIGIYTLYKRDTELYKENFNLLKEELNGEKNKEKISEYIAKLFIIDFYTLSNKDYKEDVGGIQYVYPSSKDNFILNASNTMYKYLNTLNEKPTVNKIDLNNIEKTTYKIDNKEYEGYILDLSWEYEKDLEYDKKGLVTVILDNDNFYVVEKKNGN